MAFESIVLALTEDGRYQRVQLYVAGGDDEVPRRIPLYWFDQSVTDANVMLAACARRRAGNAHAQERAEADAWRMAEAGLGGAV